jgi:hypothetical protein
VLPPAPPSTHLRHAEVCSRKRGPNLKLIDKQRMHTMYNRAPVSATIQAIAEAWAVTPRTVQRVLQTQPVNPGTYKEPKLSLEQQKAFADAVRAIGPITTSDLPAVALEVTGIEISRTTAHRYMRGFYKNYAVTKAPPIKTADHPVRMAKAAELLPQVNHVICIDESTVGRLRGPTTYYGGEHPGECHKTHFPSNLRSNLLGAVCEDGPLDLSFPASNVTGSVFAKYLDGLLANRPRNQLILMDNHRAHKTAEVLEVLELYGAKAFFIPPFSPDMNVIEHVWGALKQWVAKENTREQFTSVADLDGAVQAHWHTMPMANQFKDFRKTLQSIIGAEGAYTGC